MLLGFKRLTFMPRTIHPSADINRFS